MYTGFLKGRFTADPHGVCYLTSTEVAVITEPVWVRAMVPWTATFFGLTIEPRDGRKTGPQPNTFPQPALSPHLCSNPLFSKHFDLSLNSLRIPSFDWPTRLDDYEPVCWTS